IGATAPHVAQVATAVVTSETNTSPRIPAAAFPSRVISSMSASSCRSKSFGPDVVGLVADGDEVVGDRFHEGGRATDIAARLVGWRPTGVREQVAVDSAPTTRPLGN